MHFSTFTLAIAAALPLTVSAAPHAQQQWNQPANFGHGDIAPNPSPPGKGTPPAWTSLPSTEIGKETRPAWTSETGTTSETSSQCWTLMGSTSGTQTSWTTTTTPCTSTVTSTTVTTTTLVPISGTITVTETSTISTDSTSTIPAPATFLPIQTTLPDAQYSGRGGPNPVEKRDVLDILGLGTSPAGYSGIRGMPEYAAEVTCTVSAPAATCSTTTTILTSTSTLTPDPVTATETTGTTTIYAACATSNFADGVLGQDASADQGIDGLSQAQNIEYQYMGTTAPTAYDCCVKGITLEGGVEFAYIPADTRCLVIGTPDGTCPATGQLSNTGTALTNSYGFVLGNLNCGEVNMSMCDAPYGVGC